MIVLKDRKLWYAVATLVGSTVGVGFYGIPFALQKATFGVGLIFFVFVSGMILISNLLYGEVVLRTHRRHQFVGYVRTYLGPWARRINTFNFWIAVYGALTGILIIAGQFLTTIFAAILPFSPVFWSTVFVIGISLVVFAGLRTVSRVDVIMMVAFAMIVVLIALVGIPHFSISSFNIGFTKFWFLPFGVMLFALNGLAGIPLMRELLVGRERLLRRGIVLGTLIPIIFYLLFAFIVVGVSGDVTSPDAISGLRVSLGLWIVVIGSVLGFFTSSTIFLNLATALKESLHQDFKFSDRWSWIFVALVPYLLFLSGVRNFIDVIGVVGGVAVSIDTILLIFVYVQARRKGSRLPEYSFRVPNFVLYLLIAVFAAGAVYTIFSA